MRSALPKTTTEIIAAIVSIDERMMNLEENVKECQKTIADHAVEARLSNERMNKTIADMQFSVGSMQQSMANMQKTLDSLAALSASIDTVTQLIWRVGKFVVGLSTIVGVMVAIMKSWGM